MDELVGSAVEDNPAFIENQEFGAVVDAVVWDRFDFACLLIEAVPGEEEGILQTVGDHQRRGVGDVALLDDEFNDGGRGDWIEATGG